MCPGCCGDLTLGMRSSPVTTATFRSTPALLMTSCIAAAHARGFTPPALLTTRMPAGRRHWCQHSQRTSPPDSNRLSRYQKVVDSPFLWMSLMNGAIATCTKSGVKPRFWKRNITRISIVAFLIITFITSIILIITIVTFITNILLLIVVTFIATIVIITFITNILIIITILTFIASLSSSSSSSYHRRPTELPFAILISSVD